MKSRRIKNRYLRMAVFILVSPIYIWNSLSVYFDGKEFADFVKEVWRQ